MAICVLSFQKKIFLSNSSTFIKYQSYLSSIINQPQRLADKDVDHFIYLHGLEKQCRGPHDGHSIYSLNLCVPYNYFSSHCLRLVDPYYLTFIILLLLILLVMNQTQPLCDYFESSYFKRILFALIVNSGKTILKYILSLHKHIRETATSHCRCFVLFWGNQFVSTYGGCE